MDKVPSGCMPKMTMPSFLRRGSSSRQSQTEHASQGETSEQPKFNNTKPQNTFHHIPCLHSHPTSEGSSNNLWLIPENSKDDDETTIGLPPPPAYSPSPNMTGSSWGKDEKEGWKIDSNVLKTIESEIDGFSDELRAVSLDIHDHPELGFHEYHAHKVLTKFMSSHGFEVTPHLCNLETAWSASFTHTSKSSTKTSGKPIVLGLNSEMDALPGIGHACGHNLICIIGIAIALSLRATLIKHDISGTILLLGTPAEEGGAGKIKLIEAGAYKDMDVCLMAHPGAGGVRGVGVKPSLAIVGLTVEFFGHTSHASAAPWEAQNALDAAFLAYSAVSVLRQQIRPDHRVHGIVEGRDWAPNIIPDYAKMRWFVRAPSAAEAEVLKQRVLACFRGAAESTACKYTITETEVMKDLRQNPVLAEEFLKVGGEERYVGGGFRDVGMEGAIGGSTDFGNVTYELPGFHPSFAIPTKPNGGNHTVLFTEAARRKEAHVIALDVSKVLARVGFRCLVDEEFLTKVKESFSS